MRIVVASDEPHPVHAAIVAALEARGHEVIRAAAVATGREEPWVPALEAASRQVSTGELDEGVICCWTGTGAAIVANKLPGVRAALCADPETAGLARTWNDANVLVLANRTLREDVALAILEAWFTPRATSENAEAGVAALAELDRRWRAADTVTVDVPAGP